MWFTETVYVIRRKSDGALMRREHERKGWHPTSVISLAEMLTLATAEYTVETEFARGTVEILPVALTLGEPRVKEEGTYPLH